MPNNEEFPLRVELLACATDQEWRCGESQPPRLCENWQLVYVLSGKIEERCGAVADLLGHGQFLFHEPGSSLAMTTVGEIPPEVLRIEFWTAGDAMAFFLGPPRTADMVEKEHFAHLASMVDELFIPPAKPDGLAVLRTDTAFGARQIFCDLLEILLITLARRLQTERALSLHSQKEKARLALLETVRGYFARNLNRDVKLEEVCAACGCTRATLQKVFRAKTKQGAMEYFAAMRLERARILLAEGVPPGETAVRLGYSSGAYFSRCFRAASGVTPREYRRRAYQLNEKDK